MSLCFFTVLHLLHRVPSSPLKIQYSIKRKNTCWVHSCQALQFICICFAKKWSIEMKPVQAHNCQQAAAVSKPKTITLQWVTNCSWRNLLPFFFFPCSLSFLPKITQNKTFHPKKQTINLTFQKGLAFHRHLLCWYKNRFDFLLLLLRLAFQCEFMALKATNGSLLVLQQVTSLLAGVQVVVCLDETVLQAWPDVGVDALKPCC